MFQTIILLCVLGFTFVQTAKEHLLCKSALLEVWITFCDEKDSPTFLVDNCSYDKKEKMNITIIWIPKMNLEQLKLVIETWHQSMKFSKKIVEICSDMDGEYEFCNILKGETTQVSILKDLNNISFFKGTFIIRLWLFAGEKEDLAFCFNATLIFK
ncbi:lymphocyte antigen 96 [Bombina bombina]|uniref:lymphocyte antigen 96 n=1 Tax=Bombina bombina TaxID=8345 RepID=UPI00235AD89D|nr:lymphocyte antigen 96 [Bombina bombina]